MNPIWNPETHDPILTRLHGFKLTPTEIHDRLAAMDTFFSVKTIRRHMARLNLPESEKLYRWDHPVKTSEKPNPLKLAKQILGSRLVEKPTGYWLDGLPVSLPSLMQAANGARVKAGMTQIPGPPHWQTNK